MVWWIIGGGIVFLFAWAFLQAREENRREEAASTPEARAAFQRKLDAAFTKPEGVTNAQWLRALGVQVRDDD